MGIFQLWSGAATANDAKPKIDDLQGYEWDVDEGVFKKKGSPDVGVDHPLFNTLTDNTKVNDDAGDASYRAPLLYKPVNSWAAMWHPEEANFVNKANAEWQRAPLLAKDEDQIRSSIAEHSLQDSLKGLQSGVLNHDLVSGPYNSSAIGKTKQDIAYNQRGGFEQNASTDMQQQLAKEAESRNAAIQSSDYLNKGGPFASNDSDLSNMQYRKAINDNNLSLLPQENALKTATLDNDIFEQGTRSLLNPQNRTNTIDEASLRGIKDSALLGNRDLLTKETQSDLLHRIFENSTIGQPGMRPSLGTLGLGDKGITLDTVHDPLYRDPMITKFEELGKLGQMNKDGSLMKFNGVPSFKLPPQTVVPFGDKASPKISDSTEKPKATTKFGLSEEELQKAADEYLKKKKSVVRPTTLQFP